MSSLYRPIISTYALPDGKHRTADGKRVTKATPGAVAVKRRARIFRGKYKDAAGIMRRVKLCADKTASQQILARLVSDAALAQHGMADPERQQQHKRPLADHLEDYRRHLLAKGSCQEHTDKTVARVRTILDGCRFVFIPDVSASAVAEFLHALRRDRGRVQLPPGQATFTPRELAAALGGRRPAQLARILRREGLEATGTGRKREYPRATVEALQELLCRGIGISTSNGYATAIKCFSRWLVRDRRAVDDPLAMLTSLNAQTDVRHGRRALPEAELRALLSAASANPARFGDLMGPDRAMLYAVGMTTGYRAAELASLCPPSFDLRDDGPTITVRAAYSKNRRDAIQPIPPDVAAALRVYLAGRAADCPVWPGEWHKDAAEMLRGDLAAAGIAYRDNDGVCDFHALRHAYITLLERSGVSPKLAQELARHSDIRLTMNVYTHVRLHDLAGAVDGLPALLGGPASEPHAMRATGTDGRPLRAVGRAGDHENDPLAGPEAERHGQKAAGTAEKPLRAGDRALTKPVRLGGDSLIPGETTPPPVTTDWHMRTTAENTSFESDCDLLRLSERKLPGLDSNQDKESQNLLCYRYTTG